MKISIGVPSRDYGRFLEASLASIRAQRDVDFEVLIADGGSTDDSLEIARRYETEDLRFRVVSTADRGQAHAVQRAFEASSGDVFGFLNADDCYLRDDALAKVANAFLERRDIDVVTLGGAYLDENGRRLRPVRLHRHPFASPHDMRYRTAVLQPATFWRRHVQESIPLRIDLHYAFDVWFFYKAHCRYRWATLPYEIAGYRLHGANKSVSVRPDRIRELAAFERRKFGPHSRRGRYLDVVGSLAERAERFGVAENALKRSLYLCVNSLSYLTIFRVPGI
jgi:glycosyltransferase involved in cell wall biosynthesis